ncbi:MAG TPA: hypothetical protein VFW98_14390 [Gemmatimonadaceae bacterium]|nr:hypothetical protein [Gemmatimonadaceae bacterium]
MTALPAAFLLCALAGAAWAGPIEDLVRFAATAAKGLAAYKAHDWRSAEHAFADAYRLESQRAQSLYYLAAAAAARLGEDAKALDALDRFANFGTGIALDPDHAFAGLARSPQLAHIRAKFARAIAPRCPCRNIYVATKDPFILENAALRGRYDAPLIAGGRALNDVAIGSDGSVYASDANDGSIFRLAPGAQALRAVGGRARLKSPQGMVMSADGRTLLVTDSRAAATGVARGACVSPAAGAPCVSKGASTRQTFAATIWAPRTLG